ncbi:MAG: hypothetical protein OEL78_03220 [Hyphomicrobiales bacterium]|nr:hypothetical protein [Hyphomicrobiales bacterium]
MTTYRQSAASEIGVLLEKSAVALAAAQRRLADLDALPGALKADIKMPANSGNPTAVDGFESHVYKCYKHIAV